MNANLSQNHRKKFQSPRKNSAIGDPRLWALGLMSIGMGLKSPAVHAQALPPNNPAAHRHKYQGRNIPTKR